MKEEISIEIKVTDRCNLTCFHCVNKDGARPLNGDFFCGERFKEITMQWADEQDKSPFKVREVRMTGGEPLMNIRAVAEIAEICTVLGIETGVNTNATLLDAHTARIMKDAGIRTVKASFDASNEDTYQLMRGTGSSLKKTISGIEAAVKTRFHVILRLTLCSYNRQQLLDCYRMARDLGASRLQIKPLVSSGRAVGSGAFLSHEDLKEAFAELSDAAKDSLAEPEILCWPLAESSGLRSRICASLNKIYISTSGRVSVCNYLSQSDFIGNIESETLNDILSRRNINVYTSDKGHDILSGCPQIKYFDSR
ncbi:MAG TPA: radical SAM protein [Thermodesulfovibrionales bacterium]|nr:radical SAM protein [Thermodesulfovibrionales bacterium]